MNREKRLFLNTISSLVKQLVGIACGFILPKYILNYYGSDINGLVSSITQFIGIISFFDGGMGLVVQASLYKHIANKDDNAISAVLVSCQRFYYKLVAGLTAYVIFLILLYPRIVAEKYDYWYVATLIIAISISSFGNYCLGVTNCAIIEADQRGYVVNTVYSAATIANTIVSVILISAGYSIQLVKLCSAIVYILRPFVLAMYVKQQYNINWRIKFAEEPIKQKWNGVAQHVASVILSRTDVVVLTVYSTLASVSIYSLYQVVVVAINALIESAFSGLRPLFGDMIARQEEKLLSTVFGYVNWAVHSIATLIFSIASVLITPFILTYTAGVTDANYDQLTFGRLLCITYLIFCLRIPSYSLVMAAGRFKETQGAAILEAIINITVSIALVKPLGLIGIVVGTLFAVAYRLLYLNAYVKRQFNISDVQEYIKQYIVDALIFFSIFLLTSHVEIDKYAYSSLIHFAVRISIMGFSVCLLINLFAYYNNIKSSASFIKARLKKHR